MSKEQDFSKEFQLPESKILKYSEAASKIKEFRERGLNVFLCQGAFDIVHIGHINYIRSAKKFCDILFVGVERDEVIRINKGKGRPANNLSDRLDFLSELQSVDFVFAFEDVVQYGNTESLDTYIRRYKDLSPNAIAVSSWDPNIEAKKLQAEQSGIKLVIVRYGTPDESSTRLLKLIGY